MKTVICALLLLTAVAVSGVDRDEVTFRLWTRKTTEDYVPILFGHLQNSPEIDPRNPFKFIIHGWTDNADKDWYEAIKNEFLKKDDYNVIQVDWSKPASALYPLSVGYTKDVGNFVGELIVDLNETLAVPLENIHLIGHSLGAHVSGFAGQYVARMGRGLISRITGMDPAGPLFLLAGEDGRLSSGDADFVDIIHTDGGKFGMKKAIGHADFYPNGGSAPQPGCLLYKDIVDVASCSHTRSYWLFAESIWSEGFVASECDSHYNLKSGQCNDRMKILMGNNCKDNARGEFYLSTHDSSPFATGGQTK